MADTNSRDRARRILDVYHDKLVAQMALEIIENENAFKNPVIGNADDIIERYGQRLYFFSPVYCSLGKPIPKEKPVGSEPLGKNDFRCFGCGSLIRQQDDRCQKCGWTWTI